MPHAARRLPDTDIAAKPVQETRPATGRRPAVRLAVREERVCWPTLPRRWTATVLPTALPDMAREMVAVIRAEIPEYRRAMNGPYGRTIRRGVEQALMTILSQVVVGGGEVTAEHDELFRSLGRTEALEGRSLDVLQSAYRLGSMTAWRRVTALQEKAPLPPDTVAQLAAAIFAFMDRLATLSSEGFHQAESLRGAHSDQLRARLLKMMLDQPSTPLDGIIGLAERIGWTVPKRVQVIDVRDTADDLRALFGPDALAGTETPAATLLVPAPITASTQTLLDHLPGKARITLGCPVGLTQAPRSLQYAQLAARLRQQGVLPDVAVTVCEDHIPALLLHAEPTLTALLVERRLGPLLALNSAKRVKFARVLSAWLEHGGTQAEVADALGMHRQTVHYQFARLQELFGDQLRDPDGRLELLLALRIALPDWEQAAEVPAIG